MPYAPGPFVQVDQSAVQIAPGNYDYEDFATTSLAEIDVLTASWDPYILDMGALAADPTDPAGDVDLDAVLGALGIDIGLLEFPSIDAVVTALDVSESALNDAVGFAPAAAWTDPVQPFQEPDTQPVLAPETISESAFNPAGLVGVGQSGVFPATSVGLSNGTAVGSFNFTVGDVGVVYATGTPGADVSFSAAQYGQDLGTVTLGQIGADGTFTYKATFGPDEVGAWHEDFFVGGVFVASFDFIVAPASSTS
jgi:hypothetical protein